MKKFAGIVMMVVFATTGVMAQNNKTVSAWNFLRHQQYEEAKQAIDEASVHQQTQHDGRTWYYRAMIYTAISGNEELSKKYPNAIDVATESHIKSLEYDTRNRYRNDNLKGLQQIAIDNFNSGVKLFEAKKYIEAANSFEKYQNVLGVIEPGKVDNEALFWTAQAYYVAEDFNNAEKLLNRLIDVNYDNPWIYLAKHQIHLTEGDTSKAIATIEAGRKVYPENKDLALYETNIYIISGRHSELIDKLKDAIKLDDQNAMLYVALGNAYEKLEKRDSAVYAYSKALEIDPNSYDANFNKGIIYFNQAAEIVNKAINERDNKKYNQMKKEYEALFKQAEPFLVRAHEINPTEQSPIMSLSEIYVRMGDMEKAQEMRGKISGK